jgi:hypothetical protein
MSASAASGGGGQLGSRSRNVQFADQPLLQQTRQNSVRLFARSKIISKSFFRAFFFELRGEVKCGFVIGVVGDTPFLSPTLLLHLYP